MRMLIISTLLIAPAVPAAGAYPVELASGARVTAESYWDDGEPKHLAKPVVRLAAGPVPTGEALVSRQGKLERRLLRRQQERFEAAARGEPSAEVERLLRRFRRTRTQLQKVGADLKRLDRR